MQGQVCHQGILEIGFSPGDNEHDQVRRADCAEREVSTGGHWLKVFMALLQLLRAGFTSVWGWSVGGGEAGVCGGAVGYICSREHVLTCYSQADAYHAAKMLSLYGNVLDSLVTSCLSVWVLLKWGRPSRASFPYAPSLRPPHWPYSDTGGLCSQVLEKCVVSQKRLLMAVLFFQDLSLQVSKICPPTHPPPENRIQIWSWWL